MSINSPFIIAVIAVIAVNLCGLSYLVLRLRRVHRDLCDVHDQVVVSRGMIVDAVLKQSQALRQLNRLLPDMNMVLSVGGWAASADFLLVIAKHALTEKPQVIIECGSGTSTVVLASCAQRNGVGHVYSLDHDIEYATKTRLLLAEAGLSSFATVIDAPIEAGWYSKSAVPDLDFNMAVIDGPPASVARLARYPAGSTLLAKLKGTAFVDDAARPAEREIVARWRRELGPVEVYEYDCEKGCVALTIR